MTETSATKMKRRFEYSSLIGRIPSSRGLFLLVLSLTTPIVGVTGVDLGYFGLANSAIGVDDKIREAIKSLRSVEVFWGETRERQLTTLPCEIALAD